MSIFDIVKKAKKAADEHKAKESTGTVIAEAISTQPKPPPYRHIPTHARQDALAGAPSNWNIEEDRVRIRAEHHKRAQSDTSSQRSVRSVRSSAHASRKSASEVNLPVARRISRASSDLSIQSVMEGRRPSVYSYNGSTTVKPALKKRERPQFSRSTTRNSSFVKSPLSRTTTEEEEEYDNRVDSSSESTKSRHSASSSSSTQSQYLEMVKTARNWNLDNKPASNTTEISEAPPMAASSNLSAATEAKHLRTVSISEGDKESNWHAERDFATIAAH